MNTALVIVDIQNDYFPEGKMPLVGTGGSQPAGGAPARSFPPRASGR